MRKKLLITGGSGFLGQNIIHFLQLRDKSDFDIYNLSKTPVAINGVINIKYDAASNDNLDVDISFDYIINLLALSNDKFCEDFAYAQKINIDFTKNLLEFARKQKQLKKLIHLSSIILYDASNIAPVSEDGKLHLNYTNYSFTKGIAEYYVNYYREKFNIPIINFRLANIYGPYQKFVDSPFLIPSKITQGILEKKIDVFNLSPRRDWIYSMDAAAAINKSLYSDFVGTLNLGSGQGISVREIIQEISDQLGVEYKSLERPMTGPIDFYCDISKIQKMFNWNPEVNLKHGIVNTIEYIKKNIGGI